MAEITKAQLEAVQVDPIAAVSLVLDKIEEANGDIVIVDPASPFTFFLETIAFNSAVLRDEINTKHYRTYPKLANSNSDLYNNISYKDTKNMFSQPALNTLRFWINITNFNSAATMSATGDYKMVSIPEMSYITVEGIDFLIANRINIKQFTNGLFSIEQNVSSSELGVSTLGVLPHTITSTEDGNKMLVFDTVLKQLTRSTFTFAINKTDSFIKTVDLTDRLHYISAEVRQNGGKDKIEVSYTEVIDPTVPTIIAKLLDNQIEISIPDVYIINNLIAGSLEVTVFTTKGEIDYPINRLASDQFVISFNGIEEDVYTAAMSSVAVNNTALNRLTGGTNGKSFEELRESIISNAIGDTVSPVTSKQILDLVSRNGYYGYLLEDSITTRLYIASRTLPITSYIDVTNSNPDLLYYKTTIRPSDFVNHPKIIVSTTSDDKLIIKPYTLFKNNGGIISPLTVDEINTLNNMSSVQLITYLNTKEILFSPYSYISSTMNNVYSLRIIDFRPRIDGFDIKSNNSAILARSNISAYDIVEIATGYQIKIKLAVNSEFEQLDLSRVKAQLRIPIAGNSNIGVYFYSTYNAGIFTFNIDTEYYVNEGYELSISNGVSELATKTILLNDDIEMITYITDSDIENRSDSLTNGKVIDSSGAVTVITIEDIYAVFGTPIKNLHNNMTVAYTDRKYETYDSIVYAIYEETIYDTDDIGSLLTPNAEHTEVTYTVLHEKGSPVLDELGNPVILHNIGDYKLDEDGNPIINLNDGLIKYTDMLLLEYSEKVANPSIIPDIVDSLDTYYLDMKTYNSVLLEETSIKFKPFINNNPVKISYNNSYKTITAAIKPEVEIFVETKVTLDEEAKIMLQNTIGAIIHSFLNKEVFYILDIKDEIKKAVSFDVAAIRINLDRTKTTVLSTLEKVVLLDVTNRLKINKILTNGLGNINLIYDVNVALTKI